MPHRILSGMYTLSHILTPSHSIHARRFTKASPESTFPVLRDGEEVIADSSKIIEHLETVLLSQAQHTITTHNTLRLGVAFS